MKKEFDNLLRQALLPKEEPDFWLNQKILNGVEDKTIIPQKKKIKISVAVMIAALVLSLSSVTVYATWKYIHPFEVAQNIQDRKLVKAFKSEQALVINETQSYGEYQITLLGIISGESLSEYAVYNENNKIKVNRTYAVVAVEKINGIPMPDTAEEAYGTLEFFMSPLISGYNPAIYNITSMSGNYADVVEDGILYRLLECDNVEIFADHHLYLCVSEGMFYNAEAYYYDKSTGQISRNKVYKGVNALFHLPIDVAKANPEKAEEYIADLKLESDIQKEKLNIELEESFEVKAREENGLGKEVANYALQFVGTPYIWGGDSLTDGTDSSGFTKSVYNYFGISLLHDSRKQREQGIEITALENAKVGDLVFYDTPSHVAIYIGERLVVHAVPQEGICVSEVDFDEIASIRRILNVNIEE